MNTTNSIELLSPAKNLQCAVAAIEHGADAVYIGAPMYSARASAANSLSDIQKVVEYAHSFYCKVYVALNTILYNDEIQQAVDLIHQLHKIQVDAVIIQDVGLLECNLPPIPLHASTQMHNTTVEKVSFLEKVGFSQVVLARELSVSQIRTIREQTTIPLEYFVHGALCVCYSGQCYMSANATGRSANRGECSQMCRHKYSVKGLQNPSVSSGYFLSPKDLNLENSIEELIVAGIRSFKIEGRLKDESYVKNITALYRKKIDEIIVRNPQFYRSSHGVHTFSFEPHAYKTFNRGYTEYYSKSIQNKIATLYTPKSKGEYIGRVLYSNKTTLKIDTKIQIFQGDGLCYFDDKNELTGVLVNAIDDDSIIINQRIDIPIGTEIWRNNPIGFTKELEKSNIIRKIPVSLYVTETSEGYSITMTDTYQNTVSISKNCEKTPALQPEKVKNVIIENLKKTGDTIFIVTQIYFECNPVFFIPLSQISEVRRKLCEQLYYTRLHAYKIIPHSIQPNEVPFPVNEPIDFRLNISNDKAIEFYKRHGVYSIQKAFELQKISNVPLMTTKYCIRYEMNECPKCNKEIKKAASITISDNSNTYRVEFDCTLCRMNIYKQ